MSSPKKLQSGQKLISVSYLASLFGFSLAFFLTGLLGLEMQSAQTGVTPFWPASGIVMAAFVIYGTRLWPAVFIGMTAIAYTYDIPLLPAIIAATGSIFEIIIPLTIARKYGFTGQLNSLRELLLFIAIAWIGPVISATIGTLTFSASSMQLNIPEHNIFLIWWLGNSFGILLAGSSIILLYHYIKNFRCILISRALIGIAITATVISLFAFQNMQNMNSALILNLMIPLVILSSIISGFAGILLSISITTFILIILSPTFPAEATNQYPLGILYLDIMELWIITLTGLIVSIAYKEGVLHMKTNWLSAHDSLTALKNRHYLDKKLDRLCLGLRRQDNKFSLLFLDLNKFKHVNDTAGHLAGDACLTHIARLLEKSTRDTDTVARWGGDEFMILLPNCPEQTAKSIAKKINQQLLDHPFEYNQQVFKLSFSIGIAISNNNDSPALLIERADKASYEAKLGGEKIILSEAG